MISLCGQDMVNNQFRQNYHQYYNHIQSIMTDPMVRSYFGLIASVILIVFLILFALSPTINIILGLQKKIADQKESLTSLTTKIDDLLIAQQALSQVETLLPLLDQALPEAPAPEEIIDRVHRSASASGVVVSGLRFNSFPLDNFPKGRQTVNFSLSAAGDKDAVRRFWGGVENQLRYMRFKNLSIAYSKDRNIETQAQVEGYYFIKNAQ